MQQPTGAAVEQNVVIQTLVNGVMLSTVLILFALGLSLIFGIMHIINFAHGEIYMLGGFGMWWFYAEHDVNFALSMLVTMVLVVYSGPLISKS